MEYLKERSNGISGLIASRGEGRRNKRKAREM
jgi:hypothetical protein